MTRFTIARRAFGVLLAGFTVLLASCGGSDSGSGGTASLRVVNATSDLPSVDVYTNTDNRFPAVTPNVVTGAQGVPAGSYTIKVTSAGNPTALFSGTYSLSGNQHYTGVVWGRNGSLHFATLPEDEDPAAITTGNSRVRVYNASTDAGAFDLYLTQGVDDLANATPVISATASSTLTGYRDVAVGTYRMRVTAAGDPTKVRLDVPAVSLGDRQYASVIITIGNGGVLANGALLVQQGTYTAYPNTQARLRVVPGVENAGTVSVQVDGSTIAANLPSPPSVIASYRLVPSGSHTVAIFVNGAPVSTGPMTFTAGSDYSLVVYGQPATPQTVLVPDDNRVPAAGRYKMRLVNGAATTEPLTLTVDNTSIISDIAPGTASAYVAGTPPANGTAVPLVISSPSRTLVTTTVAPQALGIYTLFVLGGGATPAGVVVKEP